MAGEASPRAVVIAAGGAVGASLRYGLGRAFPVDAGGFPTTTLAVNVVGSFVLGLVLVLLVERLRPIRHLRSFVAIGLLGAFTTYSTFAVESVTLLDDGHVGAAVGYVVASVVLGLAAAVVGGFLARRVPAGRWALDAGSGPR